VDSDSQRLGDDLGPEKIVFLREPRVGLEAIVVIDNVACGPAVGGVRMAPDVTVEEVYRLARAMTFKNAAAGLPHGGGKAGIRGDPGAGHDEKQALLRCFARLIRELESYIPGPDMGTDEECMAWIRDEIGRVAGLPSVVGGIPLDEIGATGFGLAVAAAVAAPRIGLELAGARLAVQGFGAVGKHAARFLAGQGARLVAASDSRGAVYDPNGLDTEVLLEHKETGESVGSFPAGTAMDRDELVGAECDIWIPAARPDVLTERNIGQLRARLVLQGANIPATEGAERWMHEHDILSLPDFIANAGGVICAAVEYQGGTEPQAFAAIEDKIRANTTEVLDRAAREGVPPREAAVSMARSRVVQAMGYQRA
jgi:glutamate dehydrogenase (NAD(P)+)